MWDYVNNQNKEFKDIRISKDNLQEIDWQELTNNFMKTTFRINYTMWQLDMVMLKVNEVNQNEVIIETGVMIEKGLYKMEYAIIFDFEKIEYLDIIHEILVMGFEVDEINNPVGNADVWGYEFKTFDSYDYETNVARIEKIEGRYISF